MAEPSERTLRIVRKLWSESARPGLTFQQAKLYSQHIRLSLRQPDLQSFGPEDVQARLEEAELLLASAQMERQRDPGGNWRGAAKRAGEILEWLAHDSLSVPDLPAGLLASAAYQLAGYPALARGVLAQVSEQSGTSRLVLRFLSGDFKTLLLDAADLLHHATRASPEDSAEGKLNQAIIVETVRCLSVIAACMRWGDESRLSTAVAKLEAIARIARHSQVPYSSITARLCALVASEYQHASVWHHLGKLSVSGTSGSKAALDRWCRQAFLASRSIVWASQAIGIDKLSTPESFVLCTPTGSGKTTIAELALVCDLLPSTPREDATLANDVPAPLGLYLVPSRALAAEVEGRLESSLAGLGEPRVVVTGLYGGTDWGPTDAWLTSDRPTVLVCTYEKAEALLRFLGPVFMRRVRVVIIDEAHSVSFDGNMSSLKASDNRQLRLEILSARLFRALEGCRFRLVALSAVTAGIEQSLSQWLVGSPDSSPVRSDYRSTRQLIGRLECLPKRSFRIFYDLLDRNSLAFADGDDATPYVPAPFPAHPPAPSCEGGGPLVGLRPYLAWAAMQLAQPDDDGQRHSVLISITSNITAYANSFLTLIEEDWKSVRLPSYFAEPVEPWKVRLWQECLDTLEDYFTDESPEYRLLRLGIAVHHGKMPALLARRLKTVVETGIVRVVLATSTLSEGVNLPVEYLLIPEVHRNGTLLSRQEFLNLVGRAGRPGNGTEGRALVLLPRLAPPADRWRETRLARGYRDLLRQITRTDSAPAPSPAESPLAQLLILVRQEWSSLSRSRSSTEFLRWLETQRNDHRPEHESSVPGPPESLDTLDGVLIAAIEELEQLRSGGEPISSSQLEEALARVWEKTLAKITASEEKLLASTFLVRGSAIPTLYPDRSERRSIYRTSLPPASARQLLRRHGAIRAHLEGGAEYATWTSDEKYAFVEDTVRMIAEIPRFAPGEKIGRGKRKHDWTDVLRWWLDPANATAVPKPDQIGAWHEYVSRHFTYKTNWALGSIVSLCLEDADTTAVPTALSLQDWPKSGLPWIAFWLKELLTWGTLEPVAAFLLARGRATTRGAAEHEAQGYYGSGGIVGDPNALLDPRTIRDWAEPIRTTAQTRGESGTPTAEIPVILHGRAGDWVLRKLRVLPGHSTDKGKVQWLDVAGYPVATCKASLLDSHWTSASTDFVLDVDRKSVVVTRYL